MQSPVHLVGALETGCTCGAKLCLEVDFVGVIASRTHLCAKAGR